MFKKLFILSIIIIQLGCSKSKSTIKYNDAGLATNGTASSFIVILPQDKPKDDEWLKCVKKYKNQYTCVWTK